ncbi:MAG TPA: ATP-binding protein [Desulfatiglandales bacterium]|nr:ATP-binding protein [Desulfatiglandales bacterium]
MTNKLQTKTSTKYLEERIQYLEEVNRFTLDILEMAASLGDFQPSINKLQEPSVILKETRSRVQRLIPFQTLAFYLIDDADNSFALASCKPTRDKTFLQNEVDFLIDNGTFAWTLRERRSVIVSTKDYERQLLLHAMATSARVRGMFVGLMEKDTTNIPDTALSLLSIILLNSSNALESFDLYKMIREISKSLEKKENYRTLFEAAPDGVEVLDVRGNVVDCNKTHQVLLRRSKDKIIGNHTSEFFSPDTRGFFEQKFQVLKDTGYVEGEVELVSSDGSAIPVWRKEKAIYNGNGEFVGSVIYNRDISSLKQAEEQKRSLEARLQRAQKMEAIGTLAGGVAHDLNNILGGIVGYPELLLMQLSESNPLRKPLMTMQESGQKAATIVQDLLTLARRGVPTAEVANLNDIITEYFKSPEHEKLRLYHPHVEVDVTLEPNLLPILGSPVHLSKTIMNLVSNAAEAMTNGGTISISTQTRFIQGHFKGFETIEEGEYVTLTVSDTGVGIAARDVEKIFEPFYTKKVMGRSGTGLGMAVVWGTVKDHRGYIDVRSNEGKGTTFTLYLPITRQEQVKDESLQSIEDYRGNGASVLVVDDVKEQREIASGMLKQLGYSVISVSSGEEAVDYMKERSADLLILDMIMDPGIDGLETYRRILKLHPGQKALLASGFSETKLVREAQRLGAGAYVKKPYTFGQLGLAVKTALHR